MNTIITRKPIPINKDIAETCVAIQDCCGDCGVPDNPTVIKIKKAGTCDYLIEYDAVVCCECECDCCECKYDRICFEWDELIWSLCGRYVGDIFESNATCDNDKIGTLQFDVNVECWQATQFLDDDCE